jgi:hypothetical protein
MRRFLILVLLVNLAVLTQAQSRDRKSIAEKIQGEWIFHHYETTNEKGTVVDTFYFKRDSTRFDVGLIIKENTVDEFFDPLDFPADSTTFLGSGEIEIINDKNKLLIDFNCKGIILCGIYEFISLKKEELILKSCSDEYGRESCQITHLKRRGK